MENNWYDIFLDAICKKYPKKNQLTQELMDVLFIEREAVYRRLRKEVAFSFQEIVKIASEWKISIDEIIGVSAGQIPFLMRQINYLDPSKDEINFLQQIIQSYKDYTDDDESELMTICNKLPRQLLAGYERLNKFYMFKRVYQYGHEKDSVQFSQAVISKESSRLTADYYQAIKNFKNTNFIFDRMLFDFLVCDIQYFYSIRIINDEEKALIKKDLSALLDYLQEVANYGYYPETGKKVNIYISQLNIDTNYSYVYAPRRNVCFIHVFEKYEIFTYNKEMVENFMIWMQLKKRSSNQISEVDERNRIEYFTRQRRLLSNL